MKKDVESFAGCILADHGSTRCACPRTLVQQGGLVNKTAEADFKPSLPKLAYVEFARCLCKFELVYDRTGDQFIARNSLR
jgi:hypothetical protein